MQRRTSSTSPTQIGSSDGQGDQPPRRPSSSGQAEPNPIATYQSKFRVTPKKSYSDRMTETRSELRRTIQDALRHITQNDAALMRWPNYWKEIVERYEVIIVGWPYNDVPFRNLSDVPNLGKLELLLDKWQRKEIRFCHVADLTHEQLAGLLAQHSASQQAGA